ncbi:MAG: glycine cleavage system protein H [Candidatus Woesearchaeota archaeon]
MSDKFPKELKYDENYSWFKLDEDIVTVGVNYLASVKVKEFVFIKLPQEGDKLDKGDIYASLEAVKWSGHLTTPISGEVIDVNKDLFSKPSKLNKDPYDEWIMKFKVDDTKDLDVLMSASEVEEFYSEHLN